MSNLQKTTTKSILEVAKITTVVFRVSENNNTLKEPVTNQASVAPSDQHQRAPSPEY